MRGGGGMQRLQGRVQLAERNVVREERYSAAAGRSAGGGTSLLYIKLRHFVHSVALMRG